MVVCRTPVVLIVAGLAALLFAPMLACSSPVAPVPAIGNVPPPSYAGPQYKIVPTPDPGPLRLDAFTLLEIPQLGTFGGFAYAPQIRVSETSGTSVTVTRIDITIPERFSLPFCYTTKHVAAGTSRELFGTSGYGEYELEFDGYPGGATGDITIGVTYTSDATGQEWTVVRTGRITPGTRPVYGAPATMAGTCLPRSR